jgi:uncharacterized repeat protein (TIGR01451 family)/fimbrial isopeptide formation D2 family protein
VEDPVAIDKVFHSDPTNTTYTIGETVTYRLTVSVPEGVTQDVIVEDTLPDGLRFEASLVGAGNMGMTFENNGQAQPAGQVLTFDLGDVANPANTFINDDYFTIDITATVENVLANVDGTLLENHCRVTYLDGVGLPQEKVFDTDSQTPGNQGLVLEIVEPLLTITKQASIETPMWGEVVNYTLTVSHAVNSHANAYDIVLNDTLPIGLTYVPGSGSPEPVVTGQMLTFTLAQLDLATHTSTLTYQARIEPTAPLGVPLVNVVVAQYTTLPGDQDDERTGSDGAGGLNDLETNIEDEVVIPTQPVLSASKAVELFLDRNGDGEASPQDQLRYTVTISNSGNAIANDVVFTDTPDALTTLVSGSITSTQGTIVSGQAGIPPIEVALGAIVDGGSATITFLVELVDPFPTGTSTVANQGTVSSDELVDVPTDDPDQPGSEDPTVTRVVQADLYVVKSDNPDPVTAGRTLVYTLDFGNLGPDDGSGVVINDAIPATLTLTTASTSVGIWSYDPSTRLFSIEIGTLLAGATGQATVTCLVDTDAPLSNTAVITGDQFDPDEDNNTDEEPTVVAPGVDLSLEKTVNNPNPDYQEVLTFTLNLTNEGPSTATGIVVEDQWPSQLTYLSHATLTGVYQPATGLWSIPSLAAGATVTLVIEGRVTGLRTFDNTAEVTQVNEEDLDSTPDNGVIGEDDDDVVSIVVNDTVDLVLTKIVSEELPYPGNVLTYTIEVTNLGPSPAFGTIMRDVLPDGVVFLGASASVGNYDAVTGEWLIGLMDPGSMEVLTITFEIAAHVQNGGLIVNQARVDCDLVDINPNNNQDEAAFYVAAGVPTLSQWLLGLFTALLLGSGLWVLRRQG